MKKNAIKHMDPPKRGFGSFLRKLHIIPFLLCVILAVVFWLVTTNLNNKPEALDTDPESEEAETEETGDETSEASIASLFYAL